VIYDQHVGSIRKTMDYIRGPGRDNDPDRAKLVGGQGFGFNPKTDEDVKLAVDMMEHNARPDMQASPTKKCTKDALHISLSWPRGHRADQDEMLEAGKKFLKELGMENAMALFYRHTDRDHMHTNPKTGLAYDRDHMHLGASIIDPKTGLTYDRYQFVYRGQHQAIKWEREKDQITPSRQPQHDIAKAAEKLEFNRLKDLLQKDNKPIPHRKIEHAMGLGGHFGQDMAAHREEFKKYLKEEPERAKEKVKEQEPEPVDRWWTEPVEPGRPRKFLPPPKEHPVSDDKKLLRDGMKAADDAKDAERRKFVERLERSHDQFGGLTPYMRAALQNRPDQPEPSRLTKRVEQSVNQIRDTVSGYFRREPEPPKPTPKQPEQRVTTSQAPRDVTEPSRAPGTGNTPDRTDQTAEGREYIKRQKKGRER
jgi:Relaxase/Mobilisation nuclease domain